MKTKLFTAFAILLFIVACKKEIRLDVKQINEIDKTAEWDINATRPVFSSTETEVESSCAVFNDKISGLINTIQATFKEQAQATIILLDSAGAQQVAPFELFIQDSVFLADENYISVQISAYTMLGGANGNTDFYGINYNVKTKTFLDRKDILNDDKASEINALLKENLKDSNNCNTFDVPTVENCMAITFTRETVEFTYPKYILGPGSCGPVTISISRAALQGLLKI